MSPPRQGRNDSPPEIRIGERLLWHMHAVLEGAGNVEDGGKLVGYSSADGASVDILSAIPSGPNARRSAVELLPDGAFQEMVFRAIEMVEPRVQHVGSWHSHHSNGLDRLSEGDISGYMESVNDERYHASLFVALLVVKRFANATRWLESGGLKVYYARPGDRKMCEARTSVSIIRDHVAPGSPGIAGNSNLPRSSAALAAEEKWFREAQISSKTSLLSGRIVRRFWIGGDELSGALEHREDGTVCRLVIQAAGETPEEHRELTGMEWVAILRRALEQALSRRKDVWARPVLLLVNRVVGRREE